MADQPPDAAWRQLGAPAGLCETCAHAKLNATRKGTAYLRCTRATWDQRLPRYPRLPVIDCPGYEKAGPPGVDIVQLMEPDDVQPAVRRELTACWVAVTNAGGAAGFPFPPVDAGVVAPAVDRLADGLDPDRSRILLARIDGALAGWVSLSRDTDPLIAHWGTVRHLQTKLAYRERGVASALMRRLRHIAREEMDLEQLHLAARGGTGLEDFYGRLGWREAGRWPGKLRLAPGDTRDEILMILAPL
jgi:GNAT superfamily N-acetyltransferase